MFPQINPLQDNARIIREDFLLCSRGTGGYNYRVNTILYILCDELGAFFTAQEWMSLTYLNLIFLGGYFGHLVQIELIANTATTTYINSQCLIHFVLQPR